MKLARAHTLVALLACSCGCSRRESAPPVVRESPVDRREPAPSTQQQEPTPSGAQGEPAPSGARSAGLAAERLSAEQRTWVFERTEVGRMVAVALLPERSAAARFPVLLAFHGLGEALKGPDRGARGWIDDYALPRAIARLSAPPLTAKDFESFVEPARLARVNDSLRERPFRGLIVVCPYTPDMLRGDLPFEKVPPLAGFVTGTLLPKIVAETPSLGAEATGIDGVSLGGRAAFGIGLSAPRSFRAVAGLQAAFDLEHAEDVARRAQRAHAENSNLVFRVLTSSGDYFREPGIAIARAMQRLGLPAQLDVVDGPHDYAFNRGPGAIEMLLYHDRVLRGEAAL